jgi:hypothetical protein
VPRVVKRQRNIALHSQSNALIYGFFIKAHRQRLSV